MHIKYHLEELFGPQCLGYTCFWCSIFNVEKINMYNVLGKLFCLHAFVFVLLTSSDFDRAACCVFSKGVFPSCHSGIRIRDSGILLCSPLLLVICPPYYINICEIVNKFINKNKSAKAAEKNTVKNPPLLLLLLLLVFKKQSG